MGQGDGDNIPMTVILRTMATYGPRQPAIEGATTMKTRNPRTLLTWLLGAIVTGLYVVFATGCQLQAPAPPTPEIGWSGRRLHCRRRMRRQRTSASSRSRRTSRPAPRASRASRQLVSYRRLRVSAAGGDVGADGDRVPQLPVDKNRTPQRVGMDTRDAATSLAVYAHCARHAPTDPVHWGAVRRARGGAHGAASDGMAHRIRFF